MAGRITQFKYEAADGRCTRIFGSMVVPTDGRTEFESGRGKKKKKNLRVEPSKNKRDLAGLGKKKQKTKSKGIWEALKVGTGKWRVDQSSS